MSGPSYEQLLEIAEAAQTLIKADTFGAYKSRVAMVRDELEWQLNEAGFKTLPRESKEDAMLALQGLRAIGGKKALKRIRKEIRAERKEREKAPELFS